MKWAYGVTTVPSRKKTLLPRTLESLKDAGFPCPWLFVDGAQERSEYAQFALETTIRYPGIRTAGNWVLSLYELLYRFPECQRYAIFQDDFVTYRNLRQYLEQCKYPEDGYWNLFRYPAPRELKKDSVGWHKAKLQRGLGAVALVFNREATWRLFASEHMATRPFRATKVRRYKSIDGGIVTAMKKAGYKEYIHWPSLVQHTGDVSTTSNSKHPKATCFRGENFDAMNLLKEQEK
jgi:hypothetical protein